MQIVQINPGYIELDPKKKDETWANGIITQMRINWKPIVNPDRAVENEKYLFGNQDNRAVEAMFADPKNTNLDFTPQKPLEKVRNILTAEIENEDIQIEVNAIDPSSIEEKEADKELLSNRSDNEEVLSQLGATINLPSYNLANEKNVTGKDVFNGNISKFDEMGLDESSPEDRNYYFETFYKLKHEAALDNVIANLIKYNEARKYLPRLCNDVIKIKACALQTFVDEVNGAVNIEYLEPYTVKAIPGSRNDFKDSVCIGTEIDVTVMQLIRRLGKSFNMALDYRWLLSAINIKYNLNYTGIGESVSDVQYGHCDSMRKDQLVTMQQLYNYKVGLGYIEWKSVDGIAYKVNDDKNIKQPRIYPISINSMLPDKSKFSKLERYYEATYKSYYLIIGPSTQKLFKFGRLPYAYLEGSEDQISSFTICAYREDGPSIVDVAKPHIRILEKAVKKYEYLINKAKESGYAINMATLIALAEELTTDTKKVDPMDLLKIFNDSPNLLYTTNDKLGGNGIPVQELKNGLTQAVMEFRQIFMNCMQDINDQVGISPLRDAYAPQPREAASLQQGSLQSSRNATYYLDRMISYVMADVAVRMVSYVQDIVKYKNVNSLGYNFLSKMVGSQTLDDIASMGNEAMHRYGIFVEPFTRKFDRDEIKMMTTSAFQQGKITLDQMYMVNNVDSPKRAAMVLSYLQRKQDKQAIEMEKTKSQMAMQEAQMKHQMDMELQQLKIQGEIAAKNVEGEWLYKAHVGAAQERRQASEQQMDTDKELQQNQHNAQMQQLEMKNEEKVGQ